MSEQTQKKALQKPASNKAKGDSKSNNTGKKAINFSKAKAFILPVIVVVSVCALVFYVEKELAVLEDSITDTAKDNKSLFNDINAGRTDTLSQLNTLQQKLNELQSKQDVLSHSLSQPVQHQVDVNKDYALAEIEHLLIIANYNLQLNHDVATALSAMEAADTRLKGLTQAGVLETREQLIADMNKLRSLNQADLSGLGLYLSDLINRVSELPLKQNLINADTVDTADKVVDEEKINGSIREFFQLVLKEFESWIDIRKDDAVGKVFLLPDEIYFLHANIKLEMANARFAVFNRDTDNLHSSIEHIQAWLTDYFDLSDAGVRNIYDSLARMKKLELAFPKLDISSSLESVRVLIRMQNENINIDDKTDSDLSP